MFPAFKTYNIIAAWLNVAGFALLLFLLLSYAFLPKQKTRSHYLSVSLIIAVVFLNLGFIIPLGAKPHQCFNEVTPNDMYSSLTCAFSGAFIIAGGLSGATWSESDLERGPIVVLTVCSLRPRPVNAHTNMLEYRSWPQVFLLLSGPWLGSTCDALRCHHGVQRSFFSLWRFRMPCQSPSLYSDVLGLADRHCSSGSRHADVHVRFCPIHFDMVLTMANDTDIVSDTALTSSSRICVTADPTTGQPRLIPCPNTTHLSAQ